MKGAAIMAIDYETPRKIKDPSAPARVIGKPSTIIVGLRGPTADEIKASKGNAAGRTIQAPRGVYRYRSHDEANTQMDQWLARSLAAESRATVRTMMEQGSKGNPAVIDALLIAPTGKAR